MAANEMGKKVREKVLEAVYELGKSTVKTYTRLGAFEPECDAEVYNMLKEERK